MSLTTPTDFVLPSTLIGRADLARLTREVEDVDNELGAQKVRAKGKNDTYHMPTMSRSLSDFIELNTFDFTDDHARMILTENLRKLKDHAPIIHFTFAVDADPGFLQQLVSYVRKEIHPQALLSIGLQPALVGGVYVRTPNHVHDFSIKSLLQGKREVMVHELEGLL